jgi:hypothetical protein
MTNSTLEYVDGLELEPLFEDLMPVEPGVDDDDCDSLESNDRFILDENLDEDMEDVGDEEVEDVGAGGTQTSTDILIAEANRRGREGYQSEELYE